MAVFNGTGSADSLVGTPLSDTLYGNAGNDTLDAGAGDDTLFGGDGSDSSLGGAGNDSVWDQSGGNDTLSGGEGDDLLSTYGSSGADSLSGGPGNDSLTGGNDGDRLLGDDGADYLDGNLGNDFLEGGAGADTLFGGAGDDTLVAGPGSDSLYGGEGDDRYLIDDRVFLIIDTQGSADSARVSVDFVKLPADIELIEYAPGVRALPYWIDALLPTDAAGNQFATLLGSARQFTYGFPTALPAYYSSSDDEGVGFAAFNEAQKAFARQALAVVATVAGVEFVESVSLSVPNAIALANNRQLDSSGYAYMPSASFIGSDVFLDVGTASNLAPAEGDYSALTLIHELGHALGLKHPFVGEAVNEGPYLPVPEDDTAWTVMSYTGLLEEYYLRFSPLDIAALQYLYGPPATARAGNDLYPVSAGAPNFIWDGAGVDTLDLSALAQAATVYLTPGYWGYVGSGPAALITAPGQITVNFGSVIENLSGTTGTDRLYGNDADNRIEGNAGDDSLEGGAGNDTLIGGSGIDTAVFPGTRRNNTITWSALTGSFTVVSAAGGTDTVSGVEFLSFDDAGFAAADLQGNTAPTLTAISPLPGALEDTAFTLTWAMLAAAADEADAQGDSIGFRIEAPVNGSLTLNGAAVTPAVSVLAEGGSLVWTPAANANGTLEAFQVRATDGLLVSGAALPVRVAVGAVNDAPVVANPIPDQTRPVGAALSYTVPANAFSDVDNNTLTYSATLADGSALPSWLAFNTATRVLSGTPALSAVGTASLRVTASDGAGGTVSDVFNLTVSPDVTAPTVTRLVDDVQGSVIRSTLNIAYTWTFSEPVTGVEVADFAVTNGTAVSVTGAGSVWTVNVRPALGVSNSTIGIRLLGGSVSDLAGNGTTVTYVSNAQVIDTPTPLAPKLLPGNAFDFLVDPQVTLQTTRGAMVLELSPDAAPATVANLLAYVDAGFYDSTIFHRVIPGFVIQGGGFNTGLAYKTPTYGPIPLESANGLSNLRGTVAMARTNAADSATDQFFINLIDNLALNYASATAPGYAVFGRVVSGLSVMDAIGSAPTTTTGGLDNVPATEIAIVSMRQTLAGQSTTRNATLSLGGLEAGAQWSYSLDAGVSWQPGSGASLLVPEGSYAANAIQVRQTDAAGRTGPAGRLTSALVVQDTTAPAAVAFNPADGATGVALASNLVVTFSEAIQRGTGTIVIRDASGAAFASYDAATSSNLSIAGSTLTLDPSGDLRYGKSYSLEFAAGSVRDLAGNGLAANAAYHFTALANPVNQTFTGGAGNDSPVGGVGDDTLSGGAGNDSLTGGAGDDRLDGGSGLDEARYDSARAASSFVRLGNGDIQVSGPEGVDILHDVERAVFGITTAEFRPPAVGFDIAGTGGQAYRLYQAAFDRVPDEGGVGFWMYYIDRGFAIGLVAAEFIKSPEFTSLYGPSITNDQFIQLLYQNVLNRDPDADGYAFWKSAMANEGGNYGKAWTRSDVLEFYSDSAENKANVIGAITNGFFYESFLPPG